MSYKRLIDDVSQFNAKFGLDSLEPNTPQLMEKEFAAFRLNFMLEELVEWGEAQGLHFTVINDEAKFMAPRSKLLPDMPEKECLVKALDAAVDLGYVLIGTARFSGFHNQLFGEDRMTIAHQRVHQANLRKARGTLITDSKRGSIYDVIKPEGWISPNLDDLV